MIFMSKRNTLLKNKTLFAQRSYTRWAMDEINRYICKNEDLPVIELLEAFRLKMDRFACDARTDHGKFMFSVAYDVATNMLDEVIGLGDSK